MGDNDNNKKKERVEGRRDSTQRDTRVKTGQLRNSLSNFETWPKFNFGKPGNFETGPCNLALAGSGFETGVAVRALRFGRSALAVTCGRLIASLCSQ